jgi:hypothetical protein
MFETIISPLAIILSLCTSTGVLLHDTKVDKVAALTLFSSASANHFVTEENTAKLEATTHTHVERTSIDRASTELRGQTPGLAPRRDDKKFRLQKKVGRGFHAFDSYNLPLDAVPIIG